MLIFLLKVFSWVCFLGSAFKSIFHWKAQSFIPLVERIVCSSVHKKFYQFFFCWTYMTEMPPFLIVAKHTILFNWSSPLNLELFPRSWLSLVNTHKIQQRCRSTRSSYYSKLQDVINKLGKQLPFHWSQRQWFWNSINNCDLFDSIFFNHPASNTTNNQGTAPKG